MKGKYYLIRACSDGQYYSGYNWVPAQDEAQLYEHRKDAIIVCNACACEASVFMLEPGFPDPICTEIHSTRGTTRKL
jgi:hypothetical protein